MSRLLPAAGLGYRMLLRLLPAAFRTEYGGEMLVTFRQAMDAELARGGSVRAAAYAVRECGALIRAAYREHHPGRRRSPLSTGLYQDFRQTLRTMHRSPGFAAVTITTLSVGIAVNVVLFSMLNAIRRPELPYTSPDRLLVINEAYPPNRWTQQPTSLRTFHDLQADLRSFESLATYAQRRVSLSGPGVHIRVQAAVISSHLWALLGVRPILGRSFEAAEDLPGAAPTALISSALWRERFGNAPDVLGLRVNIDGMERTIVGVMPAGFRFPEAQELWLPLGGVLQASPPEALNNRANRGWEVVGRLRPDATVAGAVEELRGQASRISEAFPDTSRGWLLTAIPIAEESFRATGSFFAALQIGGILLAVIMCGNLGNLLLARGEQRRRELAICASLGASRWRLLRLLMLEVSLLAAAALVAAIALASWAIQAVPLMIPESIPFYIRFRIDLPVLFFAVALAGGTAVVAGLGASLRATAGDPYPVLVRSATALVATARGGRTRAVLLFLQTALASALLASALVLALGLMRFHKLDLGYDPANTLLVDVPLPLAKYTEPEHIRTFSRALLERLSNATQVASAGISSALPLYAEPNAPAIEIDADGRRLPAQANPGTYRAVTPALFAATGMRLLSGRVFTAADAAGTEPVVIVNAEAARLTFKTEQVVGRKLRFGRSAESRAWHTIVGVVANMTEQPLDPEVDARLFVPFEQQPGRAVTLTVRTVGPPEPQSQAIVAAVHQTDPTLAAETPISGTRRLSTALWPVRFFSFFAGVFSAFGLAVACGGVYGLTRYLTLARTREIALRLALGAGTMRVFLMVARQNGTPVAAGLIAGVAGSVGISNVLQHVMVGLPPVDLLAIGIAVTALAASAGLAIGVPAARVARVHPAEALRAQ